MTEQEYGGVRLRSLDHWPGYWAGEDGQIYSDKRGFPHPLKPYKNKTTRVWTVNLYRPDRRYDRKLPSGKVVSAVKPCATAVHTLVASVWLPPKPSPDHEVNHLDFDRSNNAPTNLEWLTNPANFAHFHAANPLHNCGENHPLHKLTDQDVLGIRALAGSMPLVRIAELFRISERHARNVILRVCWKHL